MPTDIVMPQMGESIVEGTITKWLKKPGDKVQRDEPLFEISTDKVDAEIPAPASGVLQDIKVSEGTTVQVNTVVGTIATDGESAAAASKPVAAPQPAPAPAEKNASAPPKAAPSQAEQQPAPAPSPAHEEEDHARSSPLVRKIAREHTVNLSQVSGTGLGGRITKQDIMAFLERTEATAAPGASAPAPARAPQPPAPAAPAPIPGDLVPATQMRKIIAQRMIESRRTSAHVHSMFEVDLTRIVNLRNKLKPEEVEGSTFTITNPGQFGAVFGLPIINQPNSAIMGVGGIAKVPLVVTDADGNDSIAIRSVVHLTLGYDHRLIDGAVADQFMALVKRTLENWSEEVG